MPPRTAPPLPARGNHEKHALTRCTDYRRAHFCSLDQMTCHRTIVAGLLIGALSCQVGLLVTVVAEPHITWGKWGSRAVPGMMAGLATSVANSFVGATVGYVPRLSTVPTQSLGGAFLCNIPDKMTTVNYHKLTKCLASTASYIW